MIIYIYIYMNIYIYDYIWLYYYYNILLYDYNFSKIPIICANIRIYVCASDSTYAKILSKAHKLRHKENSPLNQKITILIGLFLKTYHSDECAKHET